MATPGYNVGHPRDVHATVDEFELVVRMQSEFREMPGLILTVHQAARLFSLDVGVCDRVLRALVDEGVLTTNGVAFARAGVVLPLS
jgi:hypothetical protein